MNHPTHSARGPRPSAARLTRNVAPGIHRLSHAYVNCYLVEEGQRLLLVDAALPATWPYLLDAIVALGHKPADVEAIVLTHAHFDHLGVATRAQQAWDVPVYAHPQEEYIAAHPYSYAHENPRLLYPIQHPAAIPALVAIARAGGLAVPGVTGLSFFGADEVLDLPGRPRVVFSPGHTYGHCALHFAEASALLCGDALVTFNPYTGGHGPQIVSGAATADSAQALDSLTALAETDARIVLPGHGPTWREGITTAAERAFRAGPS